MNQLELSRTCKATDKSRLGGWTLLALLLLLLSGQSTYGQQGLAPYTPTYTTGITYTSISGTGTPAPFWRNALSTDDNLSSAIDIGFNFLYDGVQHCQVQLSTNGYMTLLTNTGTVGNGTGAYGYVNSNLSTAAGTLRSIAPFYDDQQTAGNLGTLADLQASIKTQTIGTAPNRVFIAEWINMQDFATGSVASLNYQVKLFEGSNNISLVYGTMTTGAAAWSYTVGLNSITLTGASPFPTTMLFTQQTANTNTFSGTAQSALATIPATNSQIDFTYGGAAPVPMAGVYTMPGSFATFTAAINALNYNGTSAPVTINVAAATNYVEDAPVLQTGCQSAPITIQKSGAGANPALKPTGTAGTADFGFRMFGVDNLTWDGIDIIENTGSAVEFGIFFSQLSDRNGCQNNVFKNFKVTLNRANTSATGILTNSAAQPALIAAGANANNSFRNFTLTNMIGGIQLNGAVLGTYNGVAQTIFLDNTNDISNDVCTNYNVIGDPLTPNDFGNATVTTFGIFNLGQKDMTITNCSISNLTGTSTGGVFGIISNGTSTVQMPANTFSQGTLKIYNNRIFGFNNTSVSAGIVAGIRANVNGNAGTQCRIVNNAIGGLSSASTVTTTRRIIGIMLQDAGTGATSAIEVWHNAMNFNPTGILCPNACIEAFTTGTGPVFTVKNNVLGNFTAAQAGSAKHYGLVSTSATVFGNTGSSSNFNDIFIANATNGFAARGNATDYVSIANWAAATTQDVNSYAINPVFAGPTDLHVANALNDLGTAIPAYVSIDATCASRSLTTPDPGIFEFTPPPCAGLPVAGTAALSAGTICANVPATLSLTGYSTETGISLQWQASFVPGGPYTPIPGATSSFYTGVLPAPGTYYITCKVTCANGGSFAVSNELTLVVNPVPTVAVSPTTGLICNPGGTAITLTASSTGGTGAVNFTWSPIAGLTPSTGSPVSANPTSTTTYIVTGTDVNSCFTTASTTITVGNAITSVTASANPTTICAGANSQLNVSANQLSTANQYGFATSTGATLDPMVGATTVVPLSTDDAPTAAPAAIGFNFMYEGVAYSQYSVSPDGWIRLGNVTAVSEFTNAVTSTTNVPKLFPLWDDLATGIDGSVKVLVTGTAPSRIFKVQWNVTVPRNTTGAANATFQAWLYEDAGRIEYRYGTVGVSPSSSVGIGGLTAANFHSTTISTNTSSPSAANDANAAAPSVGRMYVYTPPVINYLWSPTTFITGQQTLAAPVATAMTATTTYTVTATSPIGCTNSGNVTVTVTPSVTPSVTITATPSGPICAGDNVTFTATPVNEGTTPVYQWKKNSVNVGTNSPTYADNGLVNGDVITCVMTSNAACPAPATVTSNAITMTVNPIVTPSVTIAAVPGTTICSGDNVTFTATPTNGGGTPSYQWKKNGTNVGTNSASYSDNALIMGDLITCDLTTSAPCATVATATSNTITMTVNPTVTPSVTITASPSNTICNGDNVTFTAVDVNGGASPAFQWKKNGGNVGSNSNTYTDNALVNGDIITCVLTSNAVCPAPTTATSNAITMTVNPLLTPSITIAAAPNGAICAGDNVTFTATPVNGGATPAYQWKKNGGNVGTNSASYSDNGLLNGDQITCVLTSNATCATPAVATSNMITIVVNPNLTPSVTIAASPNTPICFGTNVTFTATPINGGASPAYQWKVNGTNAGTNSSTFSSTTLNNGDLVTVDLTSNATCATPATVTSNTITMVVNANVTPSVSISAFPGTSICAGTNVTFTATPTNGGGAPSYQWQLNNVNVGTNSTTYSNNALVNSDVITCILTSTDPCATVPTDTSNALTISVVTNVTPTVSITVSPGTTICPGSSATFTATPNNAGTTPSYQWKLNGGNVGTNSPTYTNGALVSGNQISCVITSSDPCALPLTAPSNIITMTVADFTAPTALCNNLTVNLNSGGTGTITAAAVNNGSTDNCTASGSLGLSLSTGTFSCANLGTNTVSLSVTDAASNIANCNATITVVDAILPAITCPANVTVNTGPGVCTANVPYVTPVGTDNCTPTTVRTTGLAAGSTFPLGVTTNTFAVSDASGNTATCAFTVTVNDGQVPTISCPANASVNATSGLCNAVFSYTAPVGADNCSGATTTQIAGLASGATFPLGATTNTFRVTDGAGNTTTCTFTVTVNDNQLPTITCPANASVSASVGTCTATFTYTAPTGADNCTGAATTQTAGLASGATFPLGVTTNIYRVTDGAGNTATCSFAVTVTDGQLPTITCPANTTVSASVGVCSASVTYTAPVGADNCTGVVTTQTAGLASGSSFPVGVTTNTFRGTDGASNTATCSFTVTVTDNQVPTISCPANISTSAGAGICTAVVTFTSPVGLDNCTSPTTVQTAGFASGASFPLGTTTNTFRVTDGAGNSATCSFNVTVTDNQLPTITCPANGTVNTSVGLCAATFIYTAPVGTDNCSGATTVRTAGLASGSSFPLGVTTNTFAVADGAGNTATCSFTVTVVDNQLPTITCPANISVNATTGACTGTATYTAPVGADNCSGAITAQTVGLASGATYPLGVTTNTFRATDAAANSATCSFTVTVIDNQLPTITCPANVSVGSSVNSCDAVASFTAPVGADNCSGVTTVQTAGLPSGATFPVGVTTNTYGTTDAAGNTATCAFTVTVTDNVAPVAACQAFTVTLDSAGNGAITAGDIDNGSSDNCLVSSISVSQTAFTCANAGSNTVTLTVTDGAGNTSTCTANVLVQAQPVTGTAVPVVINCGYNISCNGASDGSATATGAGGCPGYSYLWSNGNTTATATGLSAGVHFVTITDGASGTYVDSVTLTQPAPVSATVGTVSSSCAGDSTGAADITPAGGNDCQGYTFLWSDGTTTEDLTNVAGGNYTVTVTDANGCTGTQSVTVGTFAAPVPTFTQAGNTLTSTQAWVTYQWLLNGNAISGANSNAYTITVTGTYALLVTDSNGCEGISLDSTITGVGEPLADALMLSIYPNPARGEFKLRTETPISYGLTVSITDMFGKHLTTQTMQDLGHEAAFNISGYSAGTYMVEVVTEYGQRKMFKLVIQ